MDAQSLKMTCTAPHCRLEGWIKGDGERLPVNGAIEVVAGNLQGRLVRSDTGALALTWHAVLGECVDEVDECTLDTHDCPASTECVNAWGSYDCIPRRGTPLEAVMKEDTAQQDHGQPPAASSSKQAQHAQPARPGSYEPATPPACGIEVHVCQGDKELLWRVLTDAPTSMAATPHYQLLEEKHGLVRTLAKPPAKLYPNHLLTTNLPDADTRVRWILPPPCSSHWQRVGDLPMCPAVKMPHSIAGIVMVAAIIVGAAALLWMRLRKRPGGFEWDVKKNDDFAWPEQSTRVRYRLVDGQHMV